MSSSAYIVSLLRNGAAVALATLLTSSVGARADENQPPSAPLDPAPSQQGPQVTPGPMPLPDFDSLPDPQTDETESATQDLPDEYEDPEAALERAFVDLKSDDEMVHTAAVSVIERIWSRSGSPSMDLLLSRGKKALESEDYDAALVHLTDLVTLAPDFAEGWHLRARVHFERDDLGAAISDIGNVLAIEERHFLALAGLGTLFEQIGEQEQALDAFRRALDLFPSLTPAKEAVERLETEVEGREA